MGMFDGLRGLVADAISEAGKKAELDNAIAEYSSKAVAARNEILLNEVTGDLIELRTFMEQLEDIKIDPDLVVEVSKDTVLRANMDSGHFEVIISQPAQRLTTVYEAAVGEQGTWICDLNSPTMQDTFLDDLAENWDTVRERISLGLQEKLEKQVQRMSHENKNKQATLQTVKNKTNTFEKKKADFER